MFIIYAKFGFDNSIKIIYFSVACITILWFYRTCDDTVNNPLIVSQSSLLRNEKSLQ